MCLMMNLYLPRDIIKEIFFRIPAKDLIRLKRVCKLWYSIISDANFPNAHLAHVQPGIIFTTECDIRRDYCIDHLNVDVSIQDGKKYSIMRKGDIQLNFGRKKVINSCRGLLLLQSLSIHTKLYICNPVTCRLKSLILPKEGRFFNSYIWALVYDDTVEKFKVFGMCLSGKIALVHTLGDMETSADWRRLVMFKPSNPFLTLSPCLFVAEEKELHWLVKVLDLSDEWNAIYSIDVVTEELRLTVIPSYIPQDFRLAEVKGSLCLMNGILQDALQVWVLEDKVNSHWTQSYNIDISFPFYLRKRLGCRCPQNCSIAMRNHSPSFAGLSKILLHVEKALYLYDLKSQAMRPLTYFNEFQSLIGDGTLDHGHSGVYQPHFNSLVSWEGEAA